MYFQNAEMELNFGEKPFRFGPPRGFVGVNQAPKDCQAVNMNSGSVAAAPAKLKNNAPQAVIIEVIISSSSSGVDVNHPLLFPAL